ncbi:MAG: sulfatase-like hydrolase/transferase [Verrucomicrobiales bacterium]|nr:sulfatase-like hydrolase/transferase [Verrucomicrobiales bacterium]
MTRYRFSCLIFKEICRLCLGAALFFAPAAFGTEKPNIIFIFADDWGYGDMGKHGSTFCDTPHLDRMAAEGIDFTQFTVNSPVCSPSRVAVMTGQFPARQSVHQHFAGSPSNRKRGMPDWMDVKGPSMPRMLQGAGYKTGHFGKWHLGRGGPKENRYGYDAFATFNGSKVNEIEKKGLASVDHAEQFIREHKDESFFVNLWLHETHLAHYPRPDYMEKYKHLDEQKQVYASVIAEGDEGIGRVFALLKELEIDDKTLVVFSSDNGPEVTRGEDEKIHNEGDPGLGGYYSVGESGGLKGRKRSLFSGGIRVPFVVRWPGVAPEGLTDETSVLTAVDLLPTFLEIAGAALPSDFQPDGESVLSAFKGDGFTRSKPVFWEWKGGEGAPYSWPSLGVRHGDWKLVMNEALNKSELYNLKKDWAETTDLSADHPEVVEELTQRIKAWQATLPTAPLQHCCAPVSEKKQKKEKKQNKGKVR